MINQVYNIPNVWVRKDNKTQWDKIKNDLNKHNIRITNFAERPEEIFKFEDVYLFFWTTKNNSIRPLFFTSDLQLIDISNHDYSASKYIFVHFYKFKIAREKMKNMLTKIKNGEYETINKNTMSFLSHAPFLTLHNIEDKINIMENCIKYNQFNKDEPFSFLVLKTENNFYKSFLSEITNVYHEYNFIYEYVDPNKVYRISKVYIHKLYHDYIYNNFSEKNFINYLNRKKIYNNTLHKILFENVSQKVISIKLTNKNNGTNQVNRVIDYNFTFDPQKSHFCNDSSSLDLIAPGAGSPQTPDKNLIQCDAKTFFEKFGICYLNDHPIIIKDYMIMNSELSILSYGSNSFINMKMLNYFSGNKFIVLCTSGYNVEIDRNIPFSDRKVFNLYTFFDNVVDGNFVRYIINFEDRLDQNMFQNILTEFENNFAFKEIHYMLKNLKKRFKYCFLDNLPQYKYYLNDYRVNIFWNRIGYSLIEIFHSCEWINLDKIFDKLLANNQTDDLEKIISEKLHVIEVIKLVKENVKNWRPIFMPNRFWEIQKKNDSVLLENANVDLKTYITTVRLSIT